MAKPFRKRLQIAIDPIWVDVDGEQIMGNREKRFYSKGGLLLAKAYHRVVIGGRGPYVEFHFAHIEWANFYIPDDQLYRTKDLRVFYEEWRSIDDAFVKLYLQKKTVSYADYKINKMYISPFDLYLSGQRPVIV